jgi:hypothetical protein
MTLQHRYRRQKKLHKSGVCSDAVGKSIQEEDGLLV